MDTNIIYIYKIFYIQKLTNLITSTLKGAWLATFNVEYKIFLYLEIILLEFKK